MQRAFCGGWRRSFALQPLVCLSERQTLQATWDTLLLQGQRPGTPDSTRRCTNASTSHSSSLWTNSASDTHPVKSRYLKLLQSGALRPDLHQSQVIEHLGAMFDRLVNYCQEMQEHKAAFADYMARKKLRLQQLEAEEQQQQQQQGLPSPPPPPPSPPQQHQGGNPSPLAWVTSWLLGGRSSSSGSQSERRDKQLTEEQCAKVAAARREARVLKEMGAPPAPPATPKGLYLWGSVGTGKSLLMDLFYSAVASSTVPGLQYHRRMHFNAAMLEVHSRLNRLDQQERARHRTFEMIEGKRLGKRMPTSDQGKEQEEDEDEEEEGSPKTLDTPHHKRGLFKYWDTEVLRQREAKAAFLAIRRHLRLARTGRRHPQALARANSAQFRTVAAEFLLSPHTPQTPAAATSGATAGGAGSAPPPTASVLCFDEMQISDVFSGLALKGLLEGLTAAGCVVITTSNRAPRQLPRHGMHEDMFEHLISTLEASCDMTQLSSKNDYRRLLYQDSTLSPEAAATMTAVWQPPEQHHQHQHQLHHHQQQQQQVPYQGAGGLLGATQEQQHGRGGTVWGGAAAAAAAPPLVPGMFLYPLDPGNEQRLERAWQALVLGASRTGAPPPAPTSIPVMFGRTLEVPWATAGVARFKFEQLCAGPMGPADFVALASRFHTVMIDGIPAMNMEVRDQARRFIVLIDELYNARVRLLCSSAVPPDQLFSRGTDNAEPILDLEQLQFETAVEGSKLRRDLLTEGGVAPVASTPDEVKRAKVHMGGAEEQFAFARAVSRLYEMQSAMYLAVGAATRSWT